MFDKNAESAIQNAAEIAKARRHEYVCLEHLLYAILDNQDGSNLVRSLGGKIDGLKHMLEDFFDLKLETVSARKKNYEPTHTIGFQRAVESAIIHIEYSSASSLTIGDLLVCLFTEKDSHAVHFLEAGTQGMLCRRTTIVERFAANILKPRRIGRNSKSKCTIIRTRTYSFL